MTCEYCSNSGLVYAEKLEAHGGRYAFKCFCRHGEFRKEVLSIWQNPTKGFKILEDFIVNPDGPKTLAEYRKKQEDDLCPF